MIVKQNEAVELAFILKKNILNQHKISVLTQKHGKIYLLENSIKKSQFLWPGMLISFKLHDMKYQKQNYFVCSNIEILLSPDKNFDLNWIHHVLELCYYFIPLQDSCDKIFGFVFNCFLFSKLELIFEEHVFLIRSVSLLKFLEITGCYLSSDFSKYLQLYQNLTNFLVNIANKQKEDFLRTNLDQISEFEIKKITKWIFSCISQHPCSKLFKTCFKNNFSNL
ncbi:hypothetical protein K9L05_02790 [Candidatus Babeliales bacterium]|nr:hypothetical protein [Candidatus Babeliales bacterium]MCF7899552.1 hypothetical protein [Candidatus Babeliales bacterium]